MNNGTHPLAQGTFYRLARKYIGICVFGGAVLSAFTFVIWLMVVEGDWSKVFTFPLVLIAALVPTALIAGTVCGLIAALIVSVLATTSFVSKPLAVWCRVGAESGLLLSAAGTALIFNQSVEKQNALVLFLVFGVAGLGCGFLIALSAWHEFKR